LDTSNLCSGYQGEEKIFVEPGIFQTLGENVRKAVSNRYMTLMFYII
jgi:hypothetical protein